MAETDQPLSLLDAVRTQLTLDSDSESSQSTAVNITHKDATHENTKKTPANTPLDQSISTNPSIVLIENTNDHEPFPDFDEQVCEEHRDIEEKWQNAFAKAAQEEIRTYEIDPAIKTPPGQPETKRAVLDNIKDVLSNPRLSMSTCRRFIALTNMVIQLDHILFRRSDVFMGPDETADAAEIVKQMLHWLTWADNMLQDLVAIADNVFGIMGYLAEEDVSVVHKYRHMATVATTHLRKPRFLEQVLLSLFSDLYDVWIHNRFLHMSNRMILKEDNLDPACLALTANLHEIWMVLSRANKNYARYRSYLDEIVHVYLLPFQNMMEIPDSPEKEDVTQECPLLGGNEEV